MAELDDYEASQVRAIADWKSERPSLLLAAYRGLSRPVSKLLTRVVPRDLARKAIDGLGEHAEGHAGRDDILESAGVHDVRDLRQRPLDQCDRLASRVEVKAERGALLEGVAPALGGLALPGVGGTVSSIADIPVLLETSIRAIRRIGHCYGFPLDSEADRRFVLAVLDLANEDGAPGEHEQRLGIWTDGGEDVKKVTEGVEEAVVDDLPLESIPFAGDVANLVLDYAFVRRVDVTARRVFQERRLREDGKVDAIAPTPGFRRRGSLEGVGIAASEIAYAGAYGVSFGVTFPVALAGSIVDSVAPESMKRGLRDGASAAVRDSGEFLGSFGKAATAAFPPPEANGVLAPA